MTPHAAAPTKMAIMAMVTIISTNVKPLFSVFPILSLIVLFIVSARVVTHARNTAYTINHALTLQLLQVHILYYIYYIGKSLQKIYLFYYITVKFVFLYRNCTVWQSIQICFADSDKPLSSDYERNKPGLRGNDRDVIVRNPGLYF